ncbi:MAG: iron transporter [Alphaproteobacteria bacterium GWC2_42_16]|nr:MAG: iron transporter [Alphaproteobacteria bacterium GWC2_42_16]OFW73652.1 MAG: iron transporter [Alphaproteobacteria bacterium GWA2_41_27]OFW81968.1 MAG: iron transporter [Alphaproteobacteria bacterium RIFCSPHIGHO2_12_FULL_42_100]OFW85978.1 MAG: iron transporter [Alphaproteobacteria bacterium RBG_16_42_14]OFW91104.1 MAG: iron transporter [Alphaproteobacteria bacterium RIFCSPHIGHO2_02_FULL_42_30]OFW93592.1 MAG: iron transporter [Alphaproteobacteria bacterium RIFCSPHIGHO2_12_42_13]OFX05143.
MFIQTEETPNPATMKFLPGRTLMSEGTIEFKSLEEASKSPLALKLFEIHGVKGIFFGADFITVSKDDSEEWAVLKPEVLGTIMEHFVTHQPLFYDKRITTSSKYDDDPIVGQIQEILDTRIRPAVAMDGGDIVFDRFEEGIVYVHMQGACSGCPSSAATLKSGIENMLHHYVPEVLEVRAIES